MKHRFDDLPSRVLGFAGLLILAALLVLTIKVLLVPFVAALFVVYLFDPVIEALQRQGLGRGKAFLLLTAISLMGILNVVVYAPDWLRFESLGGSADTLTQRLSTQLAGFERFASSRVPILRSVNLAGYISNRATSLFSQFSRELPTLVTTFAIYLVLVPFIAFFIVKDGRKLRRKLSSMLPNRYFEMASMMFYRIDLQIGGFLRGRLIECTLVALIQLVLMAVAALYVPQPQILLVSVVCGVTSLIPYVGPLLGAAFGALLYFAGNYPMASIWVLLAIMAIAHLIDNVIIAPTILSHNVDLHPLSVVLILIIGGEVLGVLGLLIAIPVTSSLKVIAQEFYAHYQAQVR